MKGRNSSPEAFSELIIILSPYLAIDTVCTVQLSALICSGFSVVNPVVGWGSEFHSIESRSLYARPCFTYQLTLHSLLCIHFDAVNPDSEPRADTELAELNDYCAIL